MPTLFTDPRSGGVKKSSGVNVLPIVAETWAQVRDESDESVDWLLASHDTSNPSSNSVTVFQKGNGGIEACSAALPLNIPIYGGVRLERNQRFVTFFYASEGTSVLKKGKASMQKNGVLNVLQGSDGEIDVHPNMTEDQIPNMNVDSDLTKRKEETNKPTTKSTSSNYITNTTIPPNNDHRTNDTTNMDTNTDELADTNKPSNNTTTTTSTKPKRNTFHSQPYIVTNVTANNFTAIPTGKPSSNATPLDEQFPQVEELQVTEKSSPPSSTPPPVPTPTAQSNDEDNNTNTAIAIVPYSSLQGITDPTDLPDGVDPLNREQSLSNDEFEEIFNMDKRSFQKLPGWKRTSLKKANKLF